MGAVLNVNTTTPGYAPDSRYSTSSNKLSSLTGTYVTGLIPCANNAKIRMRGISTEQANNYNGVWIFNMNDTDGNGVYYNDKYTFERIGNEEGFHCILDDSGTIIELTLPGWQVNQTHIAICSQSITSESIITIDEEIV